MRPASPPSMLMLLLAAAHGSSQDNCAAREGVFFSNEAFPGTPGKLANERSSAEDLKQRVAAWTTEYQPIGALTAEQHRQFFEDGFVIVPKLVPHEVLDRAVASVEALVDNLAEKLLAGGKITNTHKGAGFQERLVLIEEEFPHANVLLHKNGVLPEGIQQVWGHPVRRAAQTACTFLSHDVACRPEQCHMYDCHLRLQALMDVAQQLLGTDVDIAGHPVWNLRCKTPERLSNGQATVPWHQDNAYLDEESWATLQVTAWVPLVDTNAENGCMQVVRGAHRLGGTATHACCVGGTWYTEVTPEELEATLGANMQARSNPGQRRTDALPFTRPLAHTPRPHAPTHHAGPRVQEDVVTCEVPYGSVLLLNNLIPHRSLPNYSGGIRWSLDLRWQRADEPNGFHGLKPSKVMKSAGVAYNGTVDWGEWANQDRTAAQLKQLSPSARELAFDTTIAGPWSEPREHLRGRIRFPLHARLPASRCLPDASRCRFIGGGAPRSHRPALTFPSSPRSPSHCPRFSRRAVRRWTLAHENRHTANLQPDGSMHGWGGGIQKTQDAS